MGNNAPRVRSWLIGALVILAALLVTAGLTIRYRTSAASMERRLRSALGTRGDSLYRVRVASSHLSVFGGTYLATGIEIIPDSAEFQRRRRAGHPIRDRFSLRAGSFRVTGLDVWGLLRNRLETSTAVAESLVVDVWLDRTVPVQADSVRRLPHEFFRTIRRPIRLDTFRMENSEIRYHETAVDGARPGTIRFTRTRVGVYNLTNDSLAPPRPVVIDVRTLLAGSAPATVVFEYDLRAPLLNLNYHGSVADLDARRLNDITENLEGVRLTAGRLDTAWFTFRVKDGVANGEMQLRYRHLQAEIVDKKTHKGGLSEWFQTLIANTFVLRSHNRADGDHELRTASIRGLVRPVSQPFLKFFWTTLREGMFVTVKGESSLTRPGTKETKTKRKHH
jgi:hypothetical protein